MVKKPVLRGNFDQSFQFLELDRFRIKRYYCDEVPGASKILYSKTETALSESNFKSTFLKSSKSLRNII